MAEPTTTRPAGKQEARLETTGQLLTVRPGLYSVELVATQTSKNEAGLILPCARIDPLPDTAANVHMATFAPTQLLLPGMHQAYLRATVDATVLLTIYKLAGPMPAPELRIRFIGPVEEAQREPVDALPSLPLTLTAHAERHGDIKAPGGAWAGAPDGDGPIEGFAIALQAGLPPGALVYQAVLGRDWTSPWVAGGEFCGSRGLAMALIGVRIRMHPAYAATHTVRVWGRFATAGEVGPCDDGDACESADDTLLALRVVVMDRPPAPQPVAEPPRTPPGRKAANKPPPLKRKRR